MDVKMFDQWLEIRVTSLWLIAEILGQKMDKLTLIIVGVQIRTKTIFNTQLSAVPYSKDIKDESTRH
jgi:hypothetical protein